MSFPKDKRRAGNDRQHDCRDEQVDAELLKSAAAFLLRLY